MTSADFSIEMAKRRIHDPRTREYFEDVHLAYASGSFRAATVSLWSVVIADLLFKLDELSSVHGDTTATELLADVQDRQNRNRNSPEWEWYLVEEIEKRTTFFEPHVRIELESLQKHRHLSAHPVLNQQEVLFTPNQDVARAHLRMALEDILTQPPMMTRSIFDPLMEDLEKKQQIFPDDESLSEYLKAKYLRLLAPQTLKILFRSLWRVVVVSEDERATANRAINTRALRCIFRSHRALLEPYISAEPARFEGVGSIADCRDAIHNFLREFPGIFGVLPDSVKVELRQVVKESPEKLLDAIYLHESEDQYLTFLDDLLEAKPVDFKPVKFSDILHAVSQASRKRVLLLGVRRYARAGTFNSADLSFTNCIKPYLHEFDQELLELLVDLGKDNYELYGRGLFEWSHRMIEKRWREVFGESPNREAAPNFWPEADPGNDN